jgi:hypothetical protein
LMCRAFLSPQPHLHAAQLRLCPRQLPLERVGLRRRVVQRDLDVLLLRHEGLELAWWAGGWGGCGVVFKVARLG